MTRPFSRLVVGVAVVSLFAAADWRQFRGTDANSVTGAAVPTAWDTETRENVAWKSAVPGAGVSSPIVVGDGVIVTSDSGVKRDRLHVCCYDVATGELRWERQFWATGRTFCHPTSAVAAPTPASDGQRIFAFYSSNDLACLDLQGNLLWYRGLAYDYPAAGNDVGMSSSPLVVGDTLIVQVENQGDSFAAGLDVATGESRWRRPRARQANWASPAVLRGATPEDDVVLLQSGWGLSAHHPRTGEPLWKFEGGSSIIPSPLGADGLVYLASGGLTALRGGDSGTAEVAWTNDRLGPGNASPLVRQGRLYVLRGGGVLHCADAQTGEDLWDVRLGGSYWGTPVVAGEHLYAIDQDGLARVVRLDESGGEVVAEVDFGEAVLASPAVADGALFVRSAGNLWKIAETP